MYLESLSSSVVIPNSNNRHKETRGICLQAKAPALYFGGPEFLVRSLNRTAKERLGFYQSIKSQISFSIMRCYWK
jgi:hypothetical protein